MATFRFVNHASFSISHGGATLLVDPWFFGSAFNDGWDLLVETPPELCSFEDVTHIWFSHEHPDHFSVPTIRSVPEARRPEITIIFQHTRDKRVVRFCERLGFKLVELKSGEPFELAPDFTIAVWKWGLGDSFCKIDVDGVGILNVNDCLVSTSKQAEAVAATVGSVDVLLTQFSYAGWCGNETDVERRRAEAAEKLMRIRHQIARIKPKVTIPFASFVYFSHDENFYLNDAVNTPAGVHGALGRNLAGSRIHFMYPGDVVDLHDFVAHGERYDDRGVIEKYTTAYARIAPVRHSKTVSLEQLRTAADAFGDRMRTSFGPIPKLLEMLGYVKPIVFRVTDHHDAAVRLSYRDGFVTGVRDPADCQVSSDTLSFILKNDYGFDTVEVSGQFRPLTPAGERKLSRFFAFPIFTSNGLTNLLGIGSFLFQRICRGKAPSLYVKLSSRSGW
ncbi:MAG TPA: MBL fold metallo-hydrolase [Azospirillum sp.]|nr:MBL fold metallo-hydrolase [Azospirillum sp.]